MMHLVSVSYFLPKNYILLFDFLNAARNAIRIMRAAMPLYTVSRKYLRLY